MVWRGPFRRAAERGQGLLDVLIDLSYLALWAGMHFAFERYVFRKISLQGWEEVILRALQVAFALVTLIIVFSGLVTDVVIIIRRDIRSARQWDQEEEDGTD